MDNPELKPDKTLKFTNEEVAAIQAALSVAQKVYTEMYENALKYSNGQPLEAQKKQQEYAKPFYAIACKFSDLNQTISLKEKDINP